MDHHVEHEDNALVMGKMAVRVMDGEPVICEHILCFCSDLFDLGYEAVGELDARLETVSDWQDEFRKGVVHYLEGKRVRVSLVWNLWGKVDAVRDIISQSETFEPNALHSPESV